MVDSAEEIIEKIKIQEQEQEAILKEKREYENGIKLLERNIQDSLNQKNKLHNEEKDLNEAIQKLSSKILIEKIKNEVLSSKVAVLQKECEDLKESINSNISNVWEMRSSFCEAVKQTSDEYDVLALLRKPVCTEPVEKNKTPEKQIISNEGRLKSAIARREKGIAERNRLLVESDTGEEFVRIRNALQYSLEKIASLRNAQT